MITNDLLMIDSTIIVAVISLIGLILKNKIESHNKERIEHHNNHIDQIEIAIKRINDIERRWEDCVQQLLKKVR